MGLAQGVVVGGSYAALITILDLVPRLLKLIRRKNYTLLCELALLFGAILGSLIYFFGINLKLGQIAIMSCGLLAGTFIGLTTAALAEVLNVLPVLTRRFHLLSHISKIATALILGKVIGSLLQWLVLEQ